jgi:hypothetical protein
MLMGYQQIRAECECGYKAEKIDFGSTMIMLEVKKIDYMPAYCNTCYELNGVNVLAKPTTCSKCHSSNIKIYGEPVMTGRIIKVDVTSEDFYSRFREWNDTLKRWAENEGKEFLPESIEEYRYGIITNHEEKKYEYRTPLFRRYNLCPICKEYSLRFFQHWSGLHSD